ncbi:TrbG/VirB9 family P-type conjugative transfer protein [Rhizobacter sp. LjRoot28]|uniref:TrbG/VirB9 family P-type conjugative transfer protein n=1 Tax=Rhizobacter sp. LjRoot28 TaxID=3342309 RepID=UPI003ECEAD8A
MNRPRSTPLFFTVTYSAAALLSLSPAWAQSPLVPTPVMGEARMVTFDYDDDRIYKVLVRPRNTTQLKLSPDERVTYVSAGDASSFNVNVPSSKAFVEVKPKWEDVSTNLLVVTTRRSYHIDLQSTSEGKKWYTRVAWTYAGPALLDQTEPAATRATAEGATPSDHPSSATAAGTTANGREALIAGVSVDKLYFKYEMQGDAPFRPLQVFDDGTHTYIRLADDLQELPALFMITPDSDETALVNYSINAPYLIVQRTMDKFVLKLGRAKVEVLRDSAKPGFFARLGFGRGGR